MQLKRPPIAIQTTPYPVLKPPRTPYSSHLPPLSNSSPSPLAIQAPQLNFVFFPIPTSPRKEKKDAIIIKNGTFCSFFPPSQMRLFPRVLFSSFFAFVSLSHPHSPPHLFIPSLDRYNRPRKFDNLARIKKRKKKRKTSDSQLLQKLVFFPTTYFFCLYETKWRFNVS